MDCGTPWPSSSAACCCGSTTRPSSAPAKHWTIGVSERSFTTWSSSSSVSRYTDLGISCPSPSVAKGLSLPQRCPSLFIDQVRSVSKRLVLINQRGGAVTHRIALLVRAIYRLHRPVAARFHGAHLPLLRLFRVSRADFRSFPFFLRGFHRIYLAKPS